MDATLSVWSFGFGGWIGVLGGLFLFVTVPHNYTIVTLLLSPWLGGTGVYLLMYLTQAWLQLSSQVASAMLRHEVIMALLTSFSGVLIVAIAYQIINMERGPQTPAEAAAEESAAADTEAVEEEEGGGEDGSDEESSGKDGDDEGSGSGEESGGSGDSGEEGSGGSGEEGSENVNNSGDTSSFENIPTPQLAPVPASDAPGVPTLGNI